MTFYLHSLQIASNEIEKGANQLAPFFNKYAITGILPLNERDPDAFLSFVYRQDGFELSYSIFRYS